MKQESYRSLVSGSSKGPAAASMRAGLRVLSVLYEGIIRGRNTLYDWGLLSRHQAGAAVISVGNLTTGGTGKTPLVIWLANYLTEKQIPYAVLTRGYKTDQGTLCDEPALLARACRDTAVVVNSDRVAGSKKAIDKYKACVLILDDGFQHRRLTRDLDILTIDATCPFGYGHILPAGLLREPVSSLKRAHAVILTRSDLAAPEQLVELEEAIHAVNPALPVLRSCHQSRYAKTFQNQTIELDSLRQKKIFAFCGIGNPDPFFKGLDRLGLNVTASRSFDDHYAYTEKDMERLFEEANAYEADLLLTTEKDWVKAALLCPKNSKLTMACMMIELDFLGPADTITELIDRTIAPYCSDKEPS